MVSQLIMSEIMATNFLVKEQNLQLLFQALSTVHMLSSSDSDGQDIGVCDRPASYCVSEQASHQFLDFLKQMRRLQEARVKP